MGHDIEVILKKPVGIRLFYMAVAEASMLETELINKASQGKPEQRKVSPFGRPTRALINQISQDRAQRANANGR